MYNVGHLEDSPVKSVTPSLILIKSRSQKWGKESMHKFMVW